MIIDFGYEYDFVVNEIIECGMIFEQQVVEMLHVSELIVMHHIEGGQDINHDYLIDNCLSLRLELNHVIFYYSI